MRLVDLIVQTTITMVVPDVIDNEIFESLDESIVQGLTIQESCVLDEFKFENIYDSFIKDMEVIEDSETYEKRMKQQVDDWNRSNAKKRKSVIVKNVQQQKKHSDF